MKTKSEAQVFLEQVKKLDFRIKNKLIEKQQWKDIALGITTCMEGERVQSSGSPSKMAEAVIKCVDVEAEIDALIDNLIDTKKLVVQTIERLDSYLEYDILHRRYIQFQSLQEIAEHYKTEYTNITTAHGRALKNVEALLEKYVTPGD